jgi:hypothetical protein
MSNGLLHYYRGYVSTVFEPAISVVFSSAHWQRFKILRYFLCITLASS